MVQFFYIVVVSVMFFGRKLSEKFIQLLLKKQKEIFQSLGMNKA